MFTKRKADMKIWRGRGTPTPDRVGTQSSRFTNSTVSRLPAHGGATATASALHAFNRYEIKYLVSEHQVPELRDVLRRHLDPDDHSGERGYDVRSVYYDTASLKFYWEKIEGLKFRRKLRLRSYGSVHGLDESSVVFAEIKQRVNRVTQKRRMALLYGDALRLCAGEGLELPSDAAPRNVAFVDEVTTLVRNLDLRPIVTTAYQREAYIGRDSDLGLRMTIDHRLLGRDRDFHLTHEAQNRFTLPPDIAVVELKANDRVPYWATDLMARMDLQVVRISKYCQSVEAFGLAPRSRMHAREEVDALLAQQPPSVAADVPQPHLPHFTSTHFPLQKAAR